MREYFLDAKALVTTAIMIRHSVGHGTLLKHLQTAIKVKYYDKYKNDDLFAKYVFAEIDRRFLVNRTKH